MISFRYHLVTIVAVFLALGLGVLAGTSVIDQALVDRLQRETSDLTEDNAALRTRIDELATTLAATEEFADEVFLALAPGALLDRRAVVVTQEAVDRASVASAAEALEVAGAEPDAVFTLSNRMAAGEDAARVELAEALGEPAGTDAAALRRTALERVADRLRFGPGRAPGGRQDDVLAQLLSAGFITSDGTGADELEEVGGTGTIAVVVGGGDGDAAAASELLVPFVADLRTEGVHTAAVQAADPEIPFVEEVRQADAPATVELVTVDNVDGAMGQLALALGLQRLAVLDEGGAYGVGPEASEVIPPLQGA